MARGHPCPAPFDEAWRGSGNPYGLLPSEHRHAHDGAMKSYARALLVTGALFVAVPALALAQAQPLPEAREVSEEELAPGNWKMIDLDRANLRGRIYIHRGFASADLRDAILSQAHLYQAHLSQAHLYVANLTGANQTSAFLGGADLTDSKLDGVIGYET